MRARDLIRLWFCTFALFLNVPQALAHEVHPAVLALKELSPGRFGVLWSPPAFNVSEPNTPQPHFPSQCRFESDGSLDCGARGMVGTISFDPIAALSRVTVDIEWYNGPRELRVATGEPALLLVSGTPREASLNQRVELATEYVSMGVNHILGGVDHLMFVIGLMLFVRSVKLLLWTITSFTLAHSITLALAALNLVRLSSGPVELCIALSILLLAVEATRKSETLTHRAPWLVAFTFGLLHGFGFASALAEAGLPPQHTPLALMSFNLGVEVGQLICVTVVAFGVRLLVRNARVVERVKSGAAVFLGIASVYWCLERGLVLWHSFG
jgi:hypothetical protein